MNGFHVYKDIQARTKGEFYLGVVGPVRTGKSTFIRRFMETLVLPEIKDTHLKEQARDELPQAADGKTIMTTEPKFIPKEAAEITLSDGISLKVRMIDCVGYMVNGAYGHIENDMERMVKTPWFDYEIPFTQAATIGTRKVINDHSTIGIVVTTDGSFGDIPRSAYLDAEEKTISELKSINKPFIVILNSARPYSEETAALAKELSDKYGIYVVPLDCEQLRPDDIATLLELLLEEFPVTRIDFEIPKWLELLPSSHWMKEKAVAKARRLLDSVTYMKDARFLIDDSDDSITIESTFDHMDLSNGCVSIRFELDSSYYYQILSEYIGLPINGELSLMQNLLSLARMKQEYERVLSAMESVRAKGYGVVTPTRSEITLDEPGVIRHGNKFGVKMRAQAPSIHFIKANIETEIAPIVGSEEQARDLITYINETASQSDEGIWDTNIFGKSIEQIVDDGINAKVNQMTDDCQQKLQDTMQKIINDSNGGMICIII